MTQGDPFGRDLASFWGPQGPDIDFNEVSGIDVLLQRIIRRISTPKGSVVGCPNDCIDVRTYLGAGITNADVQGIQAEIQTQILRDEAVLSCNVTSSYNTTTRALSVAIRGSSALGPFSMTLSVSAVSVQLLNTSANG